ncbi:unnamed protein product [Schistosoma curassoni]|uniref:Protein kinase domain-containing protein n=1 Tax=Schistosoma curassoni TaxID=6186 RepID=A0A183JS85_9TREM|nr:unnamed protein product [Schistosoma curassoni]
MDYSGHRTENAHGSDLFNNHTLLSGKSVTILDFELNSTCLRYNSYSIPPPPLCSTDTKSTSPNSYQYCHTESYQAVKVTWAKLRTAAPQIFQLASKMYMSHDELGELVHSLTLAKAAAAIIRDIFNDHLSNTKKCSYPFLGFFEVWKWS